MRTRALLLAGLLLLAAAGSAAAHAFLAHAQPAVGSTVSASPPALDLWFTEGVEPAFCKVAVKAADGKVITSGPPQADAKDKAHLSLPLPRLAPGRYRVEWQAVSVDTHRTKGDFAFTVGP